MIDIDFVITVHDEIIHEFGGLPGLGGGGLSAVEAAINRVNTHAYYNGLDDVFGIASLYAEAIARGHVFNDANKRTALTCAITYLVQQGIQVKRDPLLEDATVMLAEGTWTRDDFAWLLETLAGIMPD
ncbi:type II toxin-antitoxin system death-on-curing family toxin [Variovorax paradoxus]|nr:type II toxin-antitoxin system death-on-curing family toxin [Variovorax paradoxus]